MAKEDEMYIAFGYIIYSLCYQWWEIPSFFLFATVQ